MKCNFCSNSFCCSKCRLKHEQNFHEMEIEAKKKEDYIKSVCYLCHNMKFPFDTDFKFVTEDLLQHITDDHLPLECRKCAKVFRSAIDLKNVKKCCQSVVASESCGAEKFDKENIESCPQIQSPDFNQPAEDCDGEKSSTPLTQMNMRWRRKSKDFGKSDGLAVPLEEKLQRQTSTPMQKFNQINQFTDSNSTSSIHISSINCTGSTSSESDGFSPPIPSQQSSCNPQISPQRPQVTSSQSRNRHRMPAHATPLRQVMSKSIQRAILEHGHYRGSPLSLQQRKVSFVSSNSSNESLLSIVKSPGDLEAPLDLRMTPAIRRSNSDDQEMGDDNWNKGTVCGEVINAQRCIEFKHIEVIIRRGEIKSESAAFSTYKSFISETGRSESMPEFTPKIIGNNLLKKTISFEAPWTVERTPIFLLPTAVARENDEDGEIIDEVFYTPRSTPIKRTHQRSFSDVVIPMHDSDFIQDHPRTTVSVGSGSQPRNIWHFVTSVIKIATRKSEDITDTLVNNDKMWKFNFKRPEFVRRAADFFAGSREEESLEQPSKRRRTSSTVDEGAVGRSSRPSLSVKRQKIQSRKPIERMRHFS